MMASGGMMLRKFWMDRRGNYATLMAISMLPIMGGVALSVDYAQIVRLRAATHNALDAASVATARQAISTRSEEELFAYADAFFKANLGSIDPGSVRLTVTLPTTAVGGGTLKMDAEVGYTPYFLPAFSSLLGTDIGGDLKVVASTEVRLKNTLEVALVLDNSGSMDERGSGSGRKRIDLLKEAAKQLVDTIAGQGQLVQQLDEAVSFSLVPFAGSVNVGSQFATASWMDTTGLSPIHHENFNWARMNSGREITKVGGVYRKTGTGWPAAERNQIVTRFTLFNEMRRQTSSNTADLAPYTSWQGCVETRPHPYAYDNTVPSTTTPATLFVPMFAPDETDNLNNGVAARNSYWHDVTTSSNNVTRQEHMQKYFTPYQTSAAGLDQGPNAMCTTRPITPLTNVTTAAGLATIKNAIDAMQPLGATDIPEGAAWGWRTVSSKAPFTEGRPDDERGNDKVVIVLTDGFNTYYTPSSLGANDLASNRSIYSNQGYTGKNQPGETRPRIFMNTSRAVTHSNANFTAAMNEHLDRVCNAMKQSGVIVMTVALDLSSSNTTEKAALDAMERCASYSRFRRNSQDNTKAAKLFWNANGSNLADKFREIADELSNLRIIG
jgi:Flp pilus assembly protein TadG